jgi:hypothetical protein
MSIPIVLLFTAILVIFVMAFIQTRVNMKQQTKANFMTVKAHFLAQAGIQHALLKLRILPNESYAAAAITRGLCPFSDRPPTGQGTKRNDLMDVFKGDLTTKSGGYAVTQAEFPNWHYTATTISALMAGTQTSGTASTRTHAVEIAVLSEAEIRYKGVPVQVRDEVKRTVKVARSR